MQGGSGGPRSDGLFFAGTGMKTSSVPSGRQELSKAEPSQEVSGKDNEVSRRPCPASYHAKALSVSLSVSSPVFHPLILSHPPLSLCLSRVVSLVSLVSSLSRSPPLDLKENECANL